MDDKMNKKYCFTDQEFLILAGSLGIKRLYGPKPIEPVKKQEREIYQQLFRMTKKGFLEAQEDGYLVIPDIRELFRCLKEAECVIVICSMDDSFPEKCVYLGEKAVLIEPGGLLGKFFKCSYDTPEQIRRLLGEDGLLFPQNVADDILYDAAPVVSGLLEDEELIRLTAGLGAAGSMDRRKEFGKCGVRTVIEKRSVRHNSLQKRMFLVERPVYDIILVQDEEKTEIFHYSGQLLMEFLQKWMEEEDTE